jgi:hypothetical protein
MKIKITKCSKDTYWYQGHIGETFEVKEYPQYYIVPEYDYDVRGIVKEDCEVCND